MADDSGKQTGRRGLLAGAAALGGGAAAAMIPPVSAAPPPARFTRETVRFQSGGANVAGNLFLPSGDGSGNGGGLAGVVIIGPFGFVKEQSPMQYATRLARAGYACLIFDPRFSGESGGAPRRYESPEAKIADVKAAIAFLRTRPEVSPERIAALGICQGATHMIAVAAEPGRVKVLACVSGQYIYPANIDGFFGGGGPTREQRIARGRAARARFDASETVDYTKVVDPTDKSVGLPWPPIHDWYHTWEGIGWGAPTRWENRYATMSDAELWGIDVTVPAAKVRAPTLIVHGEQSDGGVAAAQTVFEHLAAADKRLVIVDGVFHTRFYDDPLVIEGAVDTVREWLDARL